MGINYWDTVIRHSIQSELDKSVATSERIMSLAHRCVQIEDERMDRQTGRSLRLLIIKSTRLVDRVRKRNDRISSSACEQTPVSDIRKRSEHGEDQPSQPTVDRRCEKIDRSKRRFCDRCCSLDHLVHWIKSQDRYFLRWRRVRPDNSQQDRSLSTSLIWFSSKWISQDPNERTLLSLRRRDSSVETPCSRTRRLESDTLRFEFPSIANRTKSSIGIRLATLTSSTTQQSISSRSSRRIRRNDFSTPRWTRSMPIDREETFGERRSTSRRTERSNRSNWAESTFVRLFVKEKENHRREIELREMLERQLMALHDDLQQLEQDKVELRQQIESVQVETSLFLVFRMIDASFRPARRLLVLLRRTSPIV